MAISSVFNCILPVACRGCMSVSKVCGLNSWFKPAPLTSQERQPCQATLAAAFNLELELRHSPGTELLGEDEQTLTHPAAHT